VKILSESIWIRKCVSMTPTTHVSLVMLIWFQELLNNISKEVNFHHQLVEDHGTSTTTVNSSDDAIYDSRLIDEENNNSRDGMFQ
jgi:hypothetical protein